MMPAGELAASGTFSAVEFTKLRTADSAGEGNDVECGECHSVAVLLMRDETELFVLKPRSQAQSSDRAIGAAPSRRGIRTTQRRRRATRFPVPAALFQATPCKGA